MIPYVKPVVATVLWLGIGWEAVHYDPDKQRQPDLAEHQSSAFVWSPTTIATSGTMLTSY